MRRTALEPERVLSSIEVGVSFRSSTYQAPLAAPSAGQTESLRSGPERRISSFSSGDSSSSTAMNSASSPAKKSRTVKGAAKLGAGAENERAITHRVVSAEAVVFIQRERAAWGAADQALDVLRIAPVSW